MIPSNFLDKFIHSLTTPLSLHKFDEFIHIHDTSGPSQSILQ